MNLDHIAETVFVNLEVVRIDPSSIKDKFGYLSCFRAFVEETLQRFQECFWCSQPDGVKVTEVADYEAIQQILRTCECVVVIEMVDQFCLARVYQALSDIGIPVGFSGEDHFSGAIQALLFQLT
jgi:hypothetical protein